MPLYLGQLLDDRSLLKALEGPPTLCDKCKKPITEADRQAEEVKSINGKPVHDDCYFNSLGEAVDTDPIPGGPARLR